jgi:Raf kinase inhibitor-like YbhB/YbcL family protein
LERKNALKHFAGIAVAAVGVASSPAPAIGEEASAPPAFRIESRSFSPHGSMARDFTCDGRDVSPPLAWSHVPAGTRSLVLIVDDPDAPDPGAPRMTWVHWVLYNLPPTSTGLSEGVEDAELPAGTRQGLNDWRRTGYSGPCPPIGRHRYFHKLYALDAILPDLGTPTKARLEEAMKGHVLGVAELMGTYGRKD